MKDLVVTEFAARSGAFRLGPLDLVVPAGQLLALAGPAAAGKSVLLLALAGFAPVLAGNAQVRGRELLQGSPDQRGIGLVTAGGALFPWMTVRDNVGFGARRRGGVVWQDRVAQALAQVGAGHLAACPAGALDPPVRLRVALARALASAPDLLLLDDPLGGLEPADRQELLALLLHLLPASGLPAIYTTRCPADLAVLGCEAGLLRAGQLVQVGPSAALLSYPDDPWCAAYVGFENVLPGRVLGRTTDGLAIAAGRGIVAFPEGPDLPRGLPVTWGVRPPWVGVEPGEGGGPNRLAGRLQQASFDGCAWRLRLDCGLPLVATVPPAALPADWAGVPPPVGEPVTAVLAIERVRLWPGQVATPAA